MIKKPRKNKMKTILVNYVKTKKVDFSHSVEQEKKTADVSLTVSMAIH